MAYGEDKIAIDKVNRNAATTESYLRVDLGIKKTDAETKNIISSTFGMLKAAFWDSDGLDPNVTFAYEKTVYDVDQSIEVNGKRFYQHPGVGNLRPYNEIGNPAGGCFSMHTIA